MPQIAKSLQDIGTDDLQLVCDEAWLEDEQCDFKLTVPHKNGPENDPWHTQRRVTDHGREQLLASVVGFANSYGGDLMIGIDETDGNPGAARAIVPLPDCMDLAERLSQQANACIEPHLSTLEVRGIPTNEDGRGVVMLRVGQSRNAPHRLTITKENYHRVRHETRAMTMRQIQDMTLDAARGLQRIDSRFAELHQAAAIWRDAKSRGADESRYTVQVALVPVTPLTVQRVHGRADVMPTMNDCLVSVNGGTAFEIASPMLSEGWRPLVRGTCASSERRGCRTRVSLFGDGAMSYELDILAAHEPPDTPVRQREFAVFWSWLMSMFGNGIKTAHRFRTVAGMGAAEYAAEVTISNTDPLAYFEQGVRALGVFESGARSLPRYVIGPPDTWTETLGLYHEDLLNAAGAVAGGERFALFQ